MFHPLPAKPGTSIPAPLPPTALHFPENTASDGFPSFQPEAGPSRIPFPPITVPSTTTCVICDSPPKYTCPKCSFKTCSLACSKAHKPKFSCTGERNPTGYIPLKDVGQGTWADDYKWLEEGRRKVAKWGEEIPRDLLRAESQSTDRGRGGLRGRGRGGGIRPRTSHADKRTMGLERELEQRGIKVEFMPEGMDRRKKNQSSWNPKTQALYLTVQLSIDSELSGDDPPKIISHNRVLVSQADPPVDFATLHSLLPPDLTSADVVFLLSMPPSHQVEGNSRLPGVRYYFPTLDPTIPILEALRGTSFIEFPSLTIMTRSKWENQLRTNQALVVPLLDVIPKFRESEHSVKRKREEDTAITRPAAKPEANDGLMALGGYASGSDIE